MSFDTQLKDRLESAASNMPGKPLDLMTTLGAARRSRRGYRIAAAAAAAAAILLVGGALAAVTIGGPEGDPDGDVTAPDPRISPFKQEAAAFAAVDGFFAAINVPGERNRAEAMWELFSPASKAYFGNDVDNFDPGSFSGETMGAWALAQDRNMRLQFVNEEWTAGVVTVTGTVSREGVIERDAIAIPVRMGDGDPTVELFSDAPYPVPSRPDIAATTITTLPRDTTLSVRVERTPRRILFLVSEWTSYDAVWRGETLLVGGPHPFGDGPQMQGTPREHSMDLAQSPLDPGRYVATFVVVSKTGELAAAAEPFVVE